MVTLQEMLSFIGFSTIRQQKSFVILLAYRDCFSKPNIDNAKLEKKSQRVVRLENSLLALSDAERNKLNLKDNYGEHKDNIINDDEVDSLLKIQFSSLRKAFEWCLNITQAYFLRESFDLEGLGETKESTGVNVSRYNPKDEISVDTLEHKYDRYSKEYQLYQCVKSLGLIDEIPIPDITNINHYIIHACVEKFAKERILFLESVFANLEKNPSLGFVNIYYPTNPRGLFNDEEALAPLLAEQFNMPEKQNLIQNVLTRHKDSKDSKSWTRDLSGLKKEILAAVGVEIWPEFPESFYYDKNNRIAYDTRAQSEGRESLKDWPTATDMVRYHLRCFSVKYPNAFKKIQLIEIIGSGKNGKIANTEDLTQAWIDQIGKNITTPENVVFISDNTMHAIDFQKRIVEPLFQSSNITMYCVGPGAKKFSIAMALDSLTKTLYAIAPTVSKKFELFSSTQSMLKPLTEKNKVSTQLNKKINSVTEKDSSQISSSNTKWVIGGSIFVATVSFFAFKFLTKENSAIFSNKTFNFDI